MLVRDFNRRMDEGEQRRDVVVPQQVIDEEAAQRNMAYAKSKLSWLSFCLFPDVVEPQRMPSMFPVPTHIIRRQKVTTLSLGAVSAGNTIYGLFRPETWDAGSAFGNSMNNATTTIGFPYDGIRSDFIWRLSTPGIDLRDNTYLTNSTIGAYGFYGHLVTPPVTGTAAGYTTGSASFTSTNVGNGGVRLIGSYLEIEYVGTVEQHSGMIEVGLRMHNAQHLSELAVPMFMDDSEIIQAPFYRKFKPADGCRVVWFPIDNGDFQFTNYATDWRSNQILEVSNTAAPGIIDDSTAFAANINLTDVSNAHGPLQKRVYPQWAVNISGLQVGQSVRISICSYYETVPDDSYRDIFMPKRTTEYIDPNRAKSAVTALAQQGAFATPAKTSSSWSTFSQAISSAVDVASKVYGVVAPIVSLGGGGMGTVGTVLNFAKSMMLE